MMRIKQDSACLNVTTAVTKQAPDKSLESFAEATDVTHHWVQCFSMKPPLRLLHC